MIKKTFTLSAINIEQLTNRASALGISASEVLRRLIEDYFKNNKEA